MKTPDDIGRLTLTLRADDSATLTTSDGPIRVTIVAAANGRAEVQFEAPKSIRIGRQRREDPPAK